MNDDEQEEVFEFALAQQALDRMKRAYERGTGCLLTREMIQELNLTVIGEMWAQENPLE